MSPGGGQLEAEYQCKREAGRAAARRSHAVTRRPKPASALWPFSWRTCRLTRSRTGGRRARTINLNRPALILDPESGIEFGMRRLVGPAQERPPAAACC